MVVVSYSGKEINAKLVYYGAGLSGKTTNLESIYEAVPDTSRGKMVSMKTQSDRTLFFDLLPLDLGEIMGFKTRFLLYTVPGQVFYNATRKLVLKGADAIVFVADSEVGKMEENKESLANLRANLAEYGLDLDQTPWVIQYNKRDLPNVYTFDELNAELNPGGKVPFFEAVATQGQGVFETFRGISHMLMEKVTRDLRRGPAGSRPASSTPAAQATPAAPIMPEVQSTPAAAPSAPASLPGAAPAIAPGQAIEQEARETTPALEPVGNADLEYGSEINLPGEIPATPEPVQASEPVPVLEPVPAAEPVAAAAQQPVMPAAPEPVMPATPESAQAAASEPAYASAPAESAPEAASAAPEASAQVMAPPIQEPAGLDTPISASDPAPAPTVSEPVFDGPEIASPASRAPGVEDDVAEPVAQADEPVVSDAQNEVVVPVTLPRGTSREIVLRIVIRSQE